MLNLIRSKNKELKNKSYGYSDSLFYYLDHYEVPYTSYSQMAGFIVIELINIFETGSLINFFTRPEIKNLQSGKQKLLLFYAREPVSYRMIKESIDLLNKNGIQNKNIVLVNGEFGSTILSEFPQDLTVIPYFWFDMTTAYNYIGRENISTKPTKKFL